MPGTVAPVNPKLAAIPDVSIDSMGRFKYILCRIYDPEKPEDNKNIVRGFTSAEFHSDLYDELDSQLEEQGLMCECLGGGKISHDSNSKQIEVFGKSQGYGKADHALTVDILKTKFSQYTSIIWSDD